MNFAIPTILVGMTYSYLPYRGSYLPNSLRMGGCENISDILEVGSTKKSQFPKKSSRPLVLVKDGRPLRGSEQFMLVISMLPQSIHKQRINVIGKTEID